MVFKIGSEAIDARWQFAVKWAFEWGFAGYI